ncbi:MAG TPA: glycosyltransferase family 2 protein [Thermoanaerobaculia bacterium]|nr:glycosyltransferase family 2 protein [Thermoanaerobaculia bacterium]
MTDPRPGSPPRISVVVPVFDEEANLAPLVAEIGAAFAGLDYELLVVDDGSRDATAATLARLAGEEPRLRPLRHDRNYGQSAALATGFAAARGELLVTLDGDLQNDPADAPRLLAELERGFDVVSGVRQRRQDSWVRKVSSRVANGVRRRVLDDGIADVGCSLKVYRTRIVKRLPPFAGMHRFLPALARMEGARITELPVAHRPRRFGKSKYNISNRLWRGIADLLGVWWLQRRWVAVAAVEEISACNSTSTASGPSSASSDRPSSSAASSSSGSPPSAPSGA